MAALVDPHTSRKSVVEYFYDGKIGNYYYGAGHPMKPHRVRLTHHLLLTTGLYRKMNVFRPSKATKEEMQSFHKSEYLDFLKLVNVDNIREFSSQMGKFNVGQDDCPMFDDLYEYCSIYAGGSLSGAVRINEGKSDVVINWSGGMHHAKKGEASGFCYVNDIVLGILELMKRHERVLYIDIDIHHGDGVEEAFYSTNRCMTLSFHQYGDFFPGTGNTDQIGHGEGKGYALNVPLQEGLDDQSFRSIYEPIVDAVMAKYNPGAVVMCCGADSITGDRLGCWNLTIKVRRRSEYFLYFVVFFYFSNLFSSSFISVFFPSSLFFFFFFLPFPPSFFFSPRSLLTDCSPPLAHSLFSTCARSYFPSHILSPPALLT